ncbi:MAG TPA: IS1595 family transposase [Chthonomonadaceae bacterium]|nr:IS1595 family transposase [Chthonomonadaceae bacterium]
MSEQSSLPKTLIEAVEYFSNLDNAHNFAVLMRWPDGNVSCPVCKASEVSFISTRRTWQCLACKKQFSVKLGTIFEDSPIAMGKWLVAIWFIANSRNGISSHEMARHLGVTQKTAWFLLHRIRRAMQTGTIEKFTGTVEVDETFVGGKAKNMHKHKREEAVKGRGGSGKAIVVGILERKKGEDDISRIRFKVVKNADQETLHGLIHSHVETGSEVFTDAHKAYRGLSDYQHAYVDHALAYVDGRIGTNGVENFWNLLDRSLHGTYTFCLPHHLLRYVTEHEFRFNNRKLSDRDRFLQAVRQVTGKRLTYEELTTSHLQFLLPKQTAP